MRLANPTCFFPLKISGARLYGWEVSVRSPRIALRCEVHLRYAYAHAEGRGAITGGLTDSSAAASGRFLLDHDRATRCTPASFSICRGGSQLAGNRYNGSGFTDGSSAAPTHLPGHTTFDMAASRSFAEPLTVSLTAPEPSEPAVPAR